MTRIALYDASGPLTDLLQKLSGENGEIWLQNLNKFLRGELNGRRAVKPKFPVWKTIKLGTHKSVGELEKSLRKRGFDLNDTTTSHLKETQLAPIETEIDLARVSAIDLGIKKDILNCGSATYDVVYEWAKELGLDLVPPEVGPQLRLQYSDQPEDELIIIASEPFDLAGFDNRLEWFCVVNRLRGQQLGVYVHESYIKFDSDFQWVFALRR